MKIPAKAVDSSLVGIFAYITVKVRFALIFVICFIHSPHKFISKKEKKMANDNHLFSRYML